MGPTASGKTQLACDLAAHYPCQIVSVDSAMVYRGMDIGSAKPSRKELMQFPHRLIDLCEPTEAYSVGRFYTDVISAIEDIFAAGDVPLLVGGTMQYFHRLQQGLAKLPQSDLGIRQDLERRMLVEGAPALHQQLAVYDPIAAERIHPNDSQRVQRALEIYYSSGQSMTDWLARDQAPAFPYQFVNAVMWPDDRAWLHQRIEQRFDLMLRQGLIEEVQAFYHQPEMHADLPSMRCVGYRQVWGYCDGHYSEATLRDKGVIATRQLAKRQITWLRSWPDAVYLTVNNEQAPGWDNALFDDFFNNLK
tara:strand:+ start:7300 stop:8214 length:915 start_codon:yes stop_codon:yes gene_type:complete